MLKKLTTLAILLIMFFQPILSFSAVLSPEYVHMIEVKSLGVVTICFTSDEPSYATLYLGNQAFLRITSNSSTKVLLPQGEYEIKSNASQARLNYSWSKVSGETLVVGPNQSVIQWVTPYSSGSPFRITVNVVGNSTFNSYLYNSSFMLISANKTWAYDTLHLSPGSYGIVVNNPHNYSEEVCLNYVFDPSYVNPFVVANEDMPMGLASYGVMNDSGNVTTYEINTSSLLGYVNISQIRTLNSSQDLANPYSASIQLNGVVSNGDQQYFIQNVIYMNTFNDTYYLTMNVFNVSLDENSLIYVSSTSVKEFTFPFVGYLVLNVSQTNGESVMRSGFVNLTSEKTYWFSNYSVKGIFDFLVNGKNYTPGNVSRSGLFYDAELVIGGGGNGEVTSLKSYNGWLALLYLNGTRYVSFPSYYSFGADTKEGVDNMHVVYLGSGEAYSYTGKENLRELKPEGTPFPLPKVFGFEKINSTRFPNTTTLIHSGDNMEIELALVSVLSGVVAIVAVLKFRSSRGK
ncbi:thermopsin family protease [Sulfuracidifex tepidarius]|uniref:Thermopsin n=1 Tax=Sulfuracidifex tepidarius TaxID=1294262 RepID=A0A510E104_9CREN|nr:thermopsin family protease [Sulfuracidifex tepidarius]BBG26175.1 Thermopsin [Sulfuracidifex tepidarius]